MYTVLNTNITREGSIVNVDTHGLYPYRAFTVPAFYSVLFNVPELSVILAMEDAGCFPKDITNYRTSFLSDITSPREISSVLNNLLIKGLLSEENLPTEIHWHSIVNGKPRCTITSFTYACKLSEIDERSISAVTERVVIACDWEGAIHADGTPMRFVILKGDLTLDCYKSFYYCKPLKYNLADIEWNQTVTLNDNETLYVNGTVKVTAACPINTNGTITIKGKDSVLYLNNTSMRQPCIGSKTNDNLSYGRWQVPNECCKKIIIDGVKVVCTSVNPFFTLGEYGTNNIPEVVLLNGGEIVAEDYQLGRYMLKGLEPLSGSTKHSDDPVYMLHNVSFENKVKVLMDRLYIKLPFEDVMKLLPTTELSDDLLLTALRAIRDNSK